MNTPFQDEDELYAHITSVHEGKKLFQCKECPLVLYHESDLENHIENHHKGIRENCAVCGESFKTAEILLKHQKRRHVPTIETLYDCKKCSQQFVGVLSYRNHLHSDEHTKNDHLKGNFRCNDCDYSSDFKSSLVNHIKNAHLKERKHSCNVCPLKFACPKDLERHMTGKHPNVFDLKKLFLSPRKEDDSKTDQSTDPNLDLNKLTTNDPSSVSTDLKPGLIKQTGYPNMKVMDSNLGSNKQKSESITNPKDLNPESIKQTGHPNLKVMDSNLGSNRQISESNSKPMALKPELIEQTPTHNTKVMDSNLRFNKQTSGSSSKAMELNPASMKQTGPPNRKIMDLKLESHKQTNNSNPKTSSAEARFPYKCNFCTIGFSKEDHLKKHVESIHEGNMPFKCAKCDTKFKHVVQLESHIDSVHKEKGQFEEFQPQIRNSTSSKSILSPPTCVW